MKATFLLWLALLSSFLLAGSAFANGTLLLDCSSNLIVTATSSNGATVFYTSAAVSRCIVPPTVSGVPPSGSTFPIGETTVICTASDPCGETTNCSFHITVIRPPLLLNCSSNLTVSATSSNGATVYFTSSASGGCSPPPFLSCNPPSGSTFPIGRTTVICTASDTCGGTTNCSFDVTVTHPPLLLNCSSNLIVSATSSNGATVYFTSSAGGGCSPPPFLSCHPLSGSTFPIGQTTVICTASDACGGTTNCSFFVTVTRPPLLLNCSSNLIVSATSSNGATVYFTSSASGGCSPPPFLSCNPPSGSTFPIGRSTVICTASDTCGGTTNCSFFVTVTRPPLLLNCSSNLIVSATSSNGATVYFTSSASGGCSPPPFLSCDPPSGSTFPIGRTTVICTASDTCGGTTNCSFFVTVTRPPLLLNCSSNLIVSATSSNGATVYFTSSASGGCSPPPFLSCDPPSGSTFPIGRTTVICTASDACGGTTNCSFFVTVTRPPLLLNCSSNLTVNATSSDGATVYFTSSASGGCSPPPFLSCNPPSGSTFPIGTNIVTCTASDDCGNTTNCSFYVTVNRARPVLQIVPKSFLAGLQFRWTEDSWMTGSLGSPPVFGLEVLTGGFSLDGGWTPFTSGFVRRINNDLLATDMIGGGASFYRLNNAVTNPVFIPSAATLYASTIVDTSANLNGLATPVADNTLYWFQYGADTNYGSFTITNSLITSTNPANLSASITGLTGLTVFHFQLVVSDDDGTQFGGDQQFTTLGPAPMVVTLDATFNGSVIGCGDCLHATAVLLNGTVNPEGSPNPAHARFEYGLDTNYGTRVGSYFTTTYASVETYQEAVLFTALSPHTTYHYRAIAFNLTGEGVGVDKTFTTP